MKDNPISPGSDRALRDNAPLQGQTNPPPHILVVEDDSYMRQLSAESLSLCGYHVDAAEDGAAAWDAIQLESYDLVITDNSMPKVTGVELLKKLRSACMALPVIMATGTLPQEEFTRSPWLQPAATLVKPYTIAQLLRTVHEVLRATDCPREQIAPPPTCQATLAKPLQL